ncbi:MAG: hypothetical protein JXQ77_00410 [Campylobacterales bacterium]|nr:hypothetical protein [Campylobacterales bacterium]
MDNKKIQRDSNSREVHLVAVSPDGRPYTSAIQKQNAHLRKMYSEEINELSYKYGEYDTDYEFPIIISSNDTPLLNTAYNGSGGHLTAGMDVHWEVQLGDDTGLGSLNLNSWIPAYVVKNPTLINHNPPGVWHSSFHNANWISYYANNKQDFRDIDAYFRYKFNLSSSIDPSKFSIEMNFYADNRVHEIYVNNIPQSTMPNGSGILPNTPPGTMTDYDGYGFYENSKVKITLNNNWRQCENEITVHVRSACGYLGFLAQVSNPYAKNHRRAAR